MKKLAMNSLYRSRIDTGTPISTKHKQLNHWPSGARARCAIDATAFCALSISFSLRLPGCVRKRIEIAGQHAEGGLRDVGLLDAGERPALAP